MQQRNVSLDILRICACIGVIMIHAAGSPEGHHWIEAGTSVWNWCAGLDALSRWSVPVFAAEFSVFTGREVRVWDKTVNDWVSGTIKTADDKSVVLVTGDTENKIAFENIAKAKFTYNK